MDSDLFNVFPREQVLVMNFDYFTQNQLEANNDILRFLEMSEIESEASILKVWIDPPNYIRDELKLRKRTTIVGSSMTTTKSCSPRRAKSSTTSTGLSTSDSRGCWATSPSAGTSTGLFRSSDQNQIRLKPRSQKRTEVEERLLRNLFNAPHIAQIQSMKLHQ